MDIDYLIASSNREFQHFLISNNLSDLPSKEIIKIYKMWVNLDQKLSDYLYLLFQ